MAKFTIEELYYGDKYGIIGRVTAEFLLAGNQAPAQEDVEMAFIKHTIQVVREMDRNGDTAVGID